MQTDLRAYVFCCAHAPDRDEWVAALREACSLHGIEGSFEPFAGHLKATLKAKKKRRLQRDSSQAAQAASVSRASGPAGPMSPNSIYGVASAKKAAGRWSLG